MLKLTSFIIVLICGIGALGIPTSPARAAPILNVVAGQLVGAQHVDVLGTLYDVQFVDGTCVAVFDGCDDAASDFAFTTEAGAVAAAQALLDQVFVDSGLGLFDSRPDKTAGCDDFSHCLTFIPYEILLSDLVSAAVSENVFDLTPDDVIVLPFAINATSSLSHSGEATWARFTLSEIVAVPEPSSMLLFGVGVAGLAGFGWRRRQG